MASLVHNFFKRPPIIFPLVSIFFIAMSIMDASFWIGDKRIDIVYWCKPLVIIVYAILWIGATFLKRWAATGFIIFTILHLLLFLFVKEDMVGKIFDNGMVTPFPINIAFAVILLFYYRKMK